MKRDLSSFHVQLVTSKGEIMRNISCCPVSEITPKCPYLEAAFEQICVQSGFGKQ